MLGMGRGGLEDADLSGDLKDNFIVQADVLVQPARVVRLFIQQPAQKKKRVQ